MPSSCTSEETAHGQSGQSLANHGPATKKTCGFTCRLHCASNLYKGFERFGGTNCQSLPSRSGLQKANYTKTASKQYLERRHAWHNDKQRNNRVMRCLEHAQRATLLCRERLFLFLASKPTRVSHHVWVTAAMSAAHHSTSSTSPS